MSTVAWYWHRLRAMNASEVAGRFKDKARRFIDARATHDWKAVLLEARNLPKLPNKTAPAELRAELQRDADAMVHGNWRAFREIPIVVDDPPKWHFDYLAKQDVSTDRSAFQLNHRQLAGGADIKMVWELSRWSQLVRLAQAGWLLGDKAAIGKCLDWLHDWTRNNPPFSGWNWTSALEAGIRLVQFTWIDALLDASGAGAALAELRYKILPPHARFVWRHKSFGSSANNHLLGELAGLILATSRWPALDRWAAPRATLRALWEGEVLAQFAEDGGNQEQALNYHLFSCELAWQTQMALGAAGLEVSKEVQERIARAAKFFVQVQVEREPWDYGDSDSACATPLFAVERNAVQEWRDWLENPMRSPALHFWLGGPALQSPPETKGADAAGWKLFNQSGIAVRHSGDWVLRWDLSPLGYLSTAAHGHFDALHLSIWFKQKAIIIDPGTGAYYADTPVRNYLASGRAHNGPLLENNESPRRLGTFLWANHHPRPEWREIGADKLRATLQLEGQELRRTITELSAARGWIVEDTNESGSSPISVRWQFAPGAQVKRLDEQTMRVEREGALMWMKVEGGAELNVP